MNRLYFERDNGKFHNLFVYPTPPVSYFSWPFCWQIDRTIEYFLPAAVGWTRSWLAVHDSRQ